ncbi:uncharacterized protein LOC118454392 [Neolamprologus brichardi]|uniref:uncharacterized protein LOC118454392 n=1 Tax=Neolamprologus brichardi TaxID=32507 RepID=UPI0016439B8E|nr:uncharacterized protein LOC118454392 [Neolamprologus brichardi]
MAAFTWIQMSSLLILMLQFKGTTEQHQTLQTVRAGRGHNVTLPCNTSLQGQHNCNSTTWIFSDSSKTPAVSLFDLGQIKEAKRKSDRLSLSADCSLVIKKVTDQDVGRYTCRQFKNATGPQEGPDSEIHLSFNNSDSVLTYEHCRLTVECLYEDKENISSDMRQNKTQSGNNTGLSLNPADTQSGPGSSQNTADADDGVSYVSISFTKKSKNKSRSRGDDDGDTVTYSTVKASSSPAGISPDPNNLYSTINYPKK